ncbi:MAG: hypothetical protein Q9164_002821 [Protoblastenia rupestris]
MNSTTIPSVTFFNLDDPALTPPPGQKSNFHNPDSRAFELYLTTGVCLPLILVFASLRFYAKIFIVGKKSWDDPIAGMVITGLFYLASMIAFVVMCAPKDGHSQSSYLRALALPQCARARESQIGVGVVNVVSDLYLILLPLPAVWGLQMPFRKKLGVSSMFLTGSIAVVSSTVALVYRVDEVISDDKTWVAIPVRVTSTIELTAGLVVCYKGDLFQSEVRANVPRVWSNRAGASKSWQAEFETDSGFPLENMQIRKTTEIEVT